MAAAPEPSVSEANSARNWASLDFRVQHAIDGGLRDRAAGFAVDDQGVVDLGALDHARRDVHAVHERQAGVANIEIQAVFAQPEIAVNDTGGGWFQVIAAYRGIDDHADFIAVDAGLVQRLLSGQGGGVGRCSAFLPETACADTGNIFQQVVADFQAIQGGFELFFDFL